MPEISRFYGIIIAMFYNDHSPPHFHVRYGEQKGLIDVETLRLLEGRLSARALELVLEWADLHHEELTANWERARNQEPLKRMPPLE